MDLGVGPRTSLYSCVCGSVVHVSCDNCPMFAWPTYGKRI